MRCGHGSITQVWLCHTRRVIATNPSHGTVVARPLVDPNRTAHSLHRRTAYAYKVSQQVIFQLL